MPQHESSEQQDARCLLCLHQVKRQGEVCPQCDPRYMALGRALLAYERGLAPMLAASPRKHIGAPMRFVPDVHFYLKELDEPVPYERWMITHQLTVLSLTPDGTLQRDAWYGYNIPSTFMAATINRDFTRMGFPEEPEYFVPISSWTAVPYRQTPPQSREQAAEGPHDQH